MKKIIRGKVYDTEKAKKLAEWSDNLSWRDFNHREETLFRKKTGELFLFGEGGPMTNYAEDTGNGWTGGSRIMPMSYSEAQRWAEEKISAEEYEEIFGEVTEDESRVTVTYSLSAGTAETIRRRAAEAGISASAYLEKIIEEAEK